jgi:tetratricopeptide (TPR) repeat protein
MQIRNWLVILLPAVLGCATANIETSKTPSRSDPTQNVAAQELYARGVALADQGQLVRAEQYLALATNRGYPDDRTLPMLLKICLAASRLRAALNYAEPYLTRHPDNLKLRYLVASLYVALEQPARAREELERVAQYDPSHAPARYLLAILMRDNFTDWSSAADHFRVYLQSSPRGEHAAEVTAWLRDHSVSQGEPAATVRKPAPEGGLI